jgi:prephenate dehydrogenase
VAQAGSHVVGSHPMAGGEQMGVSAARADLFAGTVCVVTPTPKSNPAAVRKLESLWKSVGCRLLRLGPDAHDKLVSRSSHLPHVVAAQLANLILSPGQPREQRLLCANGFRDTTRIASSSAEMWRDVALANRQHLTHTLGRFVNGLQGFRRALAEGNARAVAKFFEQARARRETWSKGAGGLRRNRPGNVSTSKHGLA